MSTPPAQKEPLTMESVLWFMKQQTVELRQQLEVDRQRHEAALAAERTLREEALATERKRQEEALATERKRREEALAAERKHREEALAAERTLREEALAAERKRREEEDKRRKDAYAEEDKRSKKAAVEFAAWKKQMQSQIGGIGNSNGEYAEQFFIRSLKRTKKLGGIEYNAVTPNWAKSTMEIDEEYDVVLHNGDSLGLVEIKYKFKKEDLTAFACRKVGNFRILYPEYSDKKIYLGIAACSFEKDVAETARTMGIAVLHKDGKNVTYDDAELKAF